MGNVTETLLDLGKVTVTRTRAITADEQARYDAYLSDKARCEAEQQKAEADRAASLFAWLGDRQAAVVGETCSRSSQFELTVEIIGKTAQAARDCAAAYERQHDGKLPRFYPAQAWHQGFRITGTRRISI